MSGWAARGGAGKTTKCGGECWCCCQSRLECAPRVCSTTHTGTGAGAGTWTCDANTNTKHKHTRRSGCGQEQEADARSEKGRARSAGSLGGSVWFVVGVSGRWAVSSSGSCNPPALGSREGAARDATLTLARPGGRGKKLLAATPARLQRASDKTLSYGPQQSPTTALAFHHQSRVESTAPETRRRCTTTTTFPHPPTTCLEKAVPDTVRTPPGWPFHSECPQIDAWLHDVSRRR